MDMLHPEKDNPAVEVDQVVAEEARILEVYFENRQADRTIAVAVVTANNQYIGCWGAARSTVGELEETAGHMSLDCMALAIGFDSSHAEAYHRSHW